MAEPSGADQVCERCGNVTQHLFPVEKPPSRICSNCYAALRLHTQGNRLTQAGVLAVVLGVAVLIALVIVLLAA